MSNQQVQAATQGRDIRALLRSDGVREQIALALPKHMTADRMTRVALTTINSNAALLKCTPESLMSCLLRCSQMGLEPDGRNAHLIPFGNQATLIVDWKGLVTLARRNGVQVTPEVVCDNDTFTVEKDDGAGRSCVHHSIDYRKPRGNVYAVYCRAKIGEEVDYEIMTKDEVEYIRRNFSRAKDAEAWTKSWNEMAKKTVIRRHSKRWPLDPEVAQAFQDEDPERPAAAEVSTAAFEGPAVPQLPPPAPTPTTTPPQGKKAAPKAEKPPQEAPKAETRPTEAAAPENATQPPAQEAPAPKESAPTNGKTTTMVEEPLTPEEDAALNGTPVQEQDKTPKAEDPRLADKESDTDAVKNVKFLARRDGVTLDQLHGWLKKVHLMKENQTHFSEMATTKLENLGRVWDKKLPEIKA